MAGRGRPRKLNPDFSRPFCNSNHVIKGGKVRGRQRYLCRNCNRCFFPDAKHPHPRWKVEQALRMYSNGMSMRAISRVLEVPLSTVFAWIKRRSNKRFIELVRLRGDAKHLASGKVVTKVVYEMWTYLRRNVKVFYKVHVVHVHHARPVRAVFSG
jgi:transposase-like protein